MNHLEVGYVRPNLLALRSPDEAPFPCFHVPSERIRYARHEHTTSAADVTSSISNKNCISIVAWKNWMAGANFGFDRL